jgi:hypothetical protein
VKDEFGTHACLRSAIGLNGGWQLLAAYELDRDAHARCMTAHGYTRRLAVPVWPSAGGR